jgi:hypothetical protein
LGCAALVSDMSGFWAIVRSPKLVIAAGFIGLVGSPPAGAQDLFGFFRLFSAPVQTEPVYRPYQSHSDPERRTIRRPKKLVRGDAPTSKIPIPIRPKAPGEVANPVTELLTDRTLRRGDLVMFPGGFRVFNGQPGLKHALTDFVPVSQAKDVVPSSTRKLLASVRPDQNLAWSTEKTQTASLLESTRNVEATGTVVRKRR